MISTVLITVLVEGGIIIGYSTWRNKPLKPLLLTSICANLITQSLLWMAVSIFFQHYRLVLLFAEAGIWMSEALLLYAVPANRLHLREAFSLSLAMNLTSLALGWFLPV